MSREDIIHFLWYMGLKDFDNFLCRFNAIIMGKLWFELDR